MLTFLQYLSESNLANDWATNFFAKKESNWQMMGCPDDFQVTSV